MPFPSLERPRQGEWKISIHFFQMHLHIQVHLREKKIEFLEARFQPILQGIQRNTSRFCVCLFVCEESRAH